MDANTHEQVMSAMQSGAGGSLLQAMQARLDGLVGQSSGLIETLPKPVQRRIHYLKRLQEQYDEKEKEYEKELDELDKKYAKLYAPIFAKRAEVVKGETEAPEDIQLESSEGEETGPKGIPEFWLNVLRTNELTASQITENDEGVLEYLVDVKSEELTGEEECGFQITFEFADNPFFEDTILTKTYHMVDANEPVLERAIGTKISWKAGKNVTVKTMKKKAKPGKGGRGNAKPIIKTEPVESFFSFFSPPKVPEDDDDLPEEDLEALQAALEEDYELGEVIRDELIPNAVSWYTGDAIAEDDDDEEEDDDDDEEDNDADEDDEDDSDDASADSDDAEVEKIKKKTTKIPADSKEQPGECKQQ